LAAVAAIAIAGCGSSSDGNSASTASATSGGSGGSGASGSKLTVALAAPTNNAVISDPYSISGAQAAINALNKRGGLAGHPLELDYCNDQVDPNQTTACASEFVKKNAIAVVGGDVTNDALYVPILQKAGIPMVGFNPYTQYSQDNLYLFNGGPIFGYNTLAAYAAKNRIPTALVVSGSPAGQRTGRSIEAAMARAGGRFTSTTLVPATQPDYAPIAASALKGNPRAVLVVLGQAQQDQFINAASAADPDVDYFVGYEIGPRDRKALSGVDLSKITFAAPFPPSNTDTPMMRRFTSEMEAQEKSGDDNAEEALHNFHGIGAWLAVQALEQAVKDGRITDVDAKTVRAQLDRTTAMDLGGVIPPWNPQARGPEGFDRVSNPTNYVIGYNSDGSPRLITPKPVSIDDALAGRF
jgi:ABC-type branched-subunit amino acid transport system substrate-binding protein